jgi:hypothetical protein
MCEDPIELLPVSQSVLHQMHIFANPEVDAFVADYIRTLRVIAKNVSFEEGPVTRIPLKMSA